MPHRAVQCEPESTHFSVFSLLLKGCTPVTQIMTWCTYFHKTDDTPGAMSSQSSLASIYTLLLPLARPRHKFDSVLIK